MPRGPGSFQDDTVLGDLTNVFGAGAISVEPSVDGMPTCWVEKTRWLDVLRWAKQTAPRPYRMLYDLTALDERQRAVREGPARDFAVVAQLLSFERNADLRLKVALQGDAPSLPSATSIWRAADWYEREVWDLFGIGFDGHPNLSRLLLPPTWRGHPLRKDYPARATECGVFSLPDAREIAEQRALEFDPAHWGLQTERDDAELMFLNVGPQHPGTHGVLRIVLQLSGERIVDAVPDIGFHHRGAEKMGERQTWHTYIPYTDRVDYLGGVVNNLAYLLAVEALAGIEVPPRAQRIRIMMCELFRIASHLVWYGTFAQDLGALSPVFYMFTDRERVFDVVTAITGARMHPNWFRIGGVSEDLPRGWERLVRELLDYLPARLADYDRMVMQNAIFKARSRGVGAYNREQAIEWGVTGPGLRACGFEWDFRKQRPYSGYDQVEFDIPTAQHGDCYARAQVRVEEMRQSLRIIRQCVDDMPSGPYKAEHPLTTPPEKARTMHDIETLIAHFLSVSWGPVIPEGEAAVIIEATKGANSYYLVSVRDIHPYRVRIRTPSFPHMQMLPQLVRGRLVPDLLAVLGSLDFVLSDVDR